MLFPLLIVGFQQKNILFTVSQPINCQGCILFDIFDKKAVGYLVSQFGAVPQLINPVSTDPGGTVVRHFPGERNLPIAVRNNHLPCCHLRICPVDNMQQQNHGDRNDFQVHGSSFSLLSGTFISYSRY